MIGADYYQHSLTRKGERSGHYRRGLVTKFSLIEDLLVPKVRKKKEIKRYMRRVEDIDGLVREMFLGGVSTRKVGEVIKPLLGYQYSAQFVSDIVKQIDTEVKKFHEREIGDEYVYLFFNGLTLKVRYNGRVHKKKALIAYGIKRNGQREIIDYALAKGELAIAWGSFVNDLWMRGLKGKNLELITTDGNPGLLEALDLVYGRKRKQRCWAHKLRNVANKCPRRLQGVIVEEGRKIYRAESRAQARR